MIVRAVVLAGAALLAGAVLAAWLQAAPPVPVVPSLHSVWCVDQGYPADLAMPLMVGPGTGLSGCPPGERQVAP